MRIEPLLNCCCEMTYLQDFASNDFQANLVELSKEKIIQIEGKNRKKNLYHYQNHNFVG